MFIINKDNFPSNEDLSGLLVRTHFKKPINVINFPNFQSTIVKEIDRIKDDLIASIRLMEVPGCNEHEKKDLCLRKIIKKKPLIDVNLVMEDGDSIHVSPVGLLALSMLSRKLIDDQVEPWLRKMVKIKNLKFNGGVDTEIQRKMKLIKVENEKLKTQLDARKTDLNIAKEVQENLSLELEGAKQERDSARERLDKLTLLEQKYIPQQDDPNSIPGLYETDTSFASRYNGIREMKDLIQSGIDYTCRDLLEIADSYTFDEITSQTEKMSLFHINKSMEIAYGAECEAHRTAIVGFFVMKLLQGASLRNPQQDGECHGEMKVVFNDNDLMIFWSKPLRIPLNPAEEPIVVFQNPTEWAPKPDTKNYPEGIDPVSAKLILHRLTDEEQNCLRRLILDPFMLLDMPLKEAYAYRDQNKERGHLVGLCYDLIHTMARALLKNYSVQIGHKLLEFFDDAEIRPFIRKEIVPNHSNSLEEKIVFWEPDMEIIPLELKDIIIERRQQLAIIWENMSANIIDPVKEKEKLLDGQTLCLRSYKEQLAKYFYIKHNFRSTNCRIESLATLLCQEATDFYKKPWAVMKMIANFLEKRENQEEFADKIAACGVTVENAIDQYRRQGKSLITNDLEIELAAHALKITIGVFVPGVPVKVHKSGLVEPTLFFGPSVKTKERLYVLSDGGVSFYALEPRLVVQGECEKRLENAITSHIDYWRNGSDDEETVMQILQFQQLLNEIL